MNPPSLINLFSPTNIIIYMLVFTRLTGLFQTMPFISTIKTPKMVKMWFAAIIAFIFYPLIHASKSFILPNSMPEFLILLALEFFIGYLIGYVANLLFTGVRVAGHILSIQMGLAMSQALDPATGVPSNEISTLYVYLTTFIFLLTGAYQIMFVVAYDSFSSVPMGFFHIFDGNVVSAVMQLFSNVFKIAFGLALPIFSVLLMSDILLGMMSKTMPHMNVYMAAIPVKIYIGLILFLVFLGSSATFLQGTIENYINAIMSLFG